jgi:hypothetical protein
MNTLITQARTVGFTILGFMLFPKVTMAQILVPIVPDCQGAFGSSETPGECDWGDLVQVGQNIIQDAVVLVAMAAVLSITYAGYLYATAGGNDGQIKKAHEVFGKVVWGIFLTLGAWLLVYSILEWIGLNDEFYK